MSKNVYVYCEGQTEESFVNRVLAPYLAYQGICCTPIICTTSRKNHGQQKFRGGAQSYERIKYELTLLCKQHRNEWVTTLFDYYGMPSDTPEINNQNPDLYARISTIEQAIEKDIGLPNLFFHFSVHEFEGLLFSRPEAFELIADPVIVEEIRQIRTDFQNPEFINNSYETAPSKRLFALIPSYAKIRYGTELSEYIGIEAICSECPHFQKWVQTIIEKTK